MFKLQFKITLILIISTPLFVFAGNKGLPYLDDNQSIEVRIEDALSRMTTEEKVAMCHAQSKFSSPGVPRLGIPELWMTDGPHGIRAESLWDEWKQAGWTNDSCFAFPALTCLAATWNEELSFLYGKSIGEEARYRNKDVLLGPGVNIYRTPLNGRNFEYMGEDPFLASKMVVPYIKGVQVNGVAACVKHFALNSQFTDQYRINVVVSDRALYEIYLPAFKAAIHEADAWAIMGAYNRFRDEQCCHNQYLLNDILRKEWGFKGVTISDWGGTHNTMQAIFNGLDMEFGTHTDGLSKNKKNAYDYYYLANPYLEKIRSGEVGTKELDEKVRRILRLVFKTKMNKKKPFGSLVSEDHILAGRKIAEEGIVLLKNDNNILPLQFNKTKTIAVIGENAIKKMMVGGGSSSLKGKYEITILEGLEKKLGTNSNIIFARGYVGDVKTDYSGVTTKQNLTDERSEDDLLNEACSIAKGADYVIYVGGLNKSLGQDSEGSDRKSMELPYNQDKIITELSKINKNLVVVNVSGNAVAMPWINQVSAVVQCWYLGSEAGNALANILTGEANPSGKLPFTFPKRLEDNAAHNVGEFPGANHQVTYNEGIFVGYRWHDTKNIEPLFCFGHGLSYTTFKYGKISTDKKEMSVNEKITFTFNVKNSGKVAGAEIIQLYIKDKESSLERPEKELKAFKKIFLQAGEAKDILFSIDKESLSFFDDKKHEWIAEPGEFEAIVGTSSKDIKGRVAFRLL